MYCAYCATDISAIVFAYVCIIRNLTILWHTMSFCYLSNKKNTVWVPQINWETTGWYIVLPFYPYLFVVVSERQTFIDILVTSHPTSPKNLTILRAENGLLLVLAVIWTTLLFPGGQTGGEKQRNREMTRQLFAQKTIGLNVWGWSRKQKKKPKNPHVCKTITFSAFNFWTCAD